MNESKNDLGKEENAITYKKPKWWFFMCVLSFPACMLPLVLSSYDIAKVLICGKLNFHMNDSYLFFMISLVTMFINTGGLIIYFRDKIIISESFITIRRAALGKTYIISQRCIMAKSMVCKFRKGRYYYNILIYLKNFKTFNTGYLNCNDKEFDEIATKFKCKEVTYRRETLKEKKANLKNVKLHNEDFVIKTNYFFQILTFFPLILLIIGVFLLSSGFNYKYGVQDNFNVSGIVVNKNAEKNKDKDKDDVNYNILVLDDSTSQKYRIGVNKDAYKQFNLNSKIRIEGKRGSLGILYDIYILKWN